MTDMRYRILGPLEVFAGGRPVPVGGPQQAALLALLLLNPNRVVSVDRLVDELWDGHPPAAGRRLLQGCVVRLRRALLSETDGVPRQPLVTAAPGYRLEVRPGELDADRFEELAAAAQRLLAERSPPAMERAALERAALERAALERAAALLREALALWHGPALDGLAASACQVQARRLEERRQAVLAERVDIDLVLGRYPDLIRELRAAIEVEPLRERLWTQLMLALYGAGRQAEALAAYGRLQQTLVEQLGVEPSGAVQQVERVIRAGGDALARYRGAPSAPSADPGPPSADSGLPSADSGLPSAGTGLPSAGTGAAAGRPTPSQLPAAVAAFTGRATHLEQLDDCLAGGDPDYPNAVVITAVTGTAGVGKTALAVHWAYRVRDRFPDGQLYVNLQGYAPNPPLRPIDALVGFLSALGVPAERVPGGVDAAAALYRSLLADKRMLVVLDNARSADQVRPLLPGGAGCLVVVTSRDRLGGLVARDGARRITLDVLEPDEATSLLERVLGAERAAADPAGIEELAEACARLPLALRIAAANLTAQPERPVGEFAAELMAGNHGNRLAALEVDGDEHSAVRAAFDLSYRALDADAQRMFRRLGLTPGPDVAAGAAAALLGTRTRDAATLLERLTTGHLLTRHRDGRYTFHDLLRMYATERAHEEETGPERDAAVGRLLDWYVDCVDAAARAIYPDLLRLPMPRSREEFDGHREALAWLDDERANLVAVVLHAAERGPRRVAWQIADTLRNYYRLRLHAMDWLTVARAGRDAAHADGDPRAEAAAHLSLAQVHMYRGQYRPAIEHGEHALGLGRQTGWRQLQGAVLGTLGSVYWHVGRLPEAIENSTEALALNREIGWHAGVAGALGNLGLAHLESGRPTEAIGYLDRALALTQQAGSRDGEAIVRSNLGDAWLALGRIDLAMDHANRSLILLRDAGDRKNEVAAHLVLAAAHRDAGRYAPARVAAQAVVTMARTLGNSRDKARGLCALGAIHHRLGQHQSAIAFHEQALRVAEETEARYPAAVALVGLTAAYLHAGRFDDAGECGERALSIARDAGYRILEGRAGTALAELHRVLGAPDRAIDLAEAALKIHRETGHRLGEAATLVVLGKARHRTDGPEVARTTWRAALGLFVEVGVPDAEEVRALLRGPLPGSLSAAAVLA